MSGRLVVVTGAEGFIGRALCRHFAAIGRPFRAVVRKPVDRHLGGAVYFAAGNLEEVSDEVLDTALAEAFAVVHLAGRAHVLEERSPNPPAAYRAANVVATARVGAAAVRCGVTRFIFASTVKVNGESTAPGRPFTPEDAIAPADDYARAKAEAERTLTALCEHTALAPALLRLPLVYGPGVRGNFAALLDAVAAHKRLPLAAITNRRSLLGIGNLVEAIEATLGSAQPVRGAHFVADEPSVSTPQLIEAIGRALSTPARLIAVPMPLLRIAGMVSGRGPQVARLIGSLEVDDTSFRAVTGWKPRCSIEDGLTATAAWWRARHSI
ncbi:MAG: NAD-dependent epimerase/dehydratase family protein [Betaproteobacteria bacterium]